MLNQATRQGIHEILSQFDDNSLLALASTTTQGFLKNKIQNRQEAVSAIINYSPDAVSFLRRKIVTREILFSYLHSKNFEINLSSVRKTDLIDKIITLWNVSSTDNAAATPDTSENVHKVTLLAEEFSKWFYNMMNEDQCIDPEHFFHDCRLKINICNNGQMQSEEVENDRQQVVQQLFCLKTNHHLFFNPNLTKDGVQGRMDPHGLVIVLACGTLHTHNTCVGIFEQVFALARDPFSENNWKIKSCEVNLKSRSEVLTIPSLHECEIMTPLLALENF